MQPKRSGSSPPTEAEPSHVRLSDSTRVEAFSDGVFAIVITILVLELRVPAHEPGQLLSALLHQWAGLLGFVVSFLYIGIVWMNHHALFTRVRFVDRGLHWINMGILMTTALLPFPTSVLADALREGNLADQRVAVALYALSAGLMSAVWLAVFPYLRDHPHLLERDTTPAYFHQQRMRPWTGVILYFVAAFTGAFVPWAGLLLLVVMVLYHALTSEGLQDAPLIGRFFG
jgi:uncharacterized membrane protein